MNTQFMVFMFNFAHAFYSFLVLYGLLLIYEDGQSVWKGRVFVKHISERWR